MVEHPARSQRVVGSNPIWDSDFFRVLLTFNDNNDNDNKNYNNKILIFPDKNNARTICTNSREVKPDLGLDQDQQ